MNRHSSYSPDTPLPSSTLVELLCQKAFQQPERRAFTFLIDGELEGDHLTYRDLDRRARAIASLLQQRTAPGERALLIYPPGLEFITAFFGCLYSGVIAVPIYPPQTRAKRSLTKLQAIAKDIQPAIALITSSASSTVESLFAEAPELQATRLITTDHIADNLAEDWQNPEVTSDTLAFLQYTSGSTGMPKGVMLTHGNLLYNLGLLHRFFVPSPDSHGVIWLPLYHDMGLIGGILEAIYCGGQSTIMSPVAFLQRPFRWLQAISNTRSTTTGGPDFAYDLCVRKITPEQKATLDLSSWEVAFNGAETIRQATMERFVEAFAPCGFRREAFNPCYGLAEATLIVSGGQKFAIPVVRTFQAAPLEQHLVIEAFTENAGTRTLVGCGRALQQKIVIVNPVSLTQCLPDQVGEVWVSGPSIAQGYWQKLEETQRTFHAYLSDTGEGPFLRTGDMGFVKDGELFITGRLKDLIIIRGRNHYPQDIELTVEQSHPALREDCGAAFSVDVFNQERLVVVHETDRQYRNVNLHEVIGAIRQAVAEEHELQVYAIVLVKTGSVVKTSSGKIQRYACREAFLAGNLQVVGEWTQQLADQLPDAKRSREQAALASWIRTEDGALHTSTQEWANKSALDAINRPLLFTRTEESNSNGSTSLQTVGADLSCPPPIYRPPGAEAKTAETISAWLVSQISQRLKIAPESINVRETLVYYGMDSVSAVSLAGDLESWLGRRLPSTLAYDYPTIEALARYLEAPDDHKRLPYSNGNQGDNGNRSDHKGLPYGNIKAEDAQRLLGHIDQLSDDQVDALLQDILQEGAHE